MLRAHTIEWLVDWVPKQIAAFQWILITERETVNGLVTACIFTLADHPCEVEAVAAVVETIPLAVLQGMAESMTRLPTQDGSWDWPPGGALLNPGGLIAWCTPVAEIQVAIQAMKACIERGLTRCGS
jgi:hypothetical protein